MKIIFMGTPDFSVPCLQRLIDDGHEVVAVFTREDKPVGRKQILTPPPVKRLALEHHIPVFQPKKLRDNPEMVDAIRALAPDFIVVVAYGRILTKEILDIPVYGCVNVHGSLLPRHRGASPIQWSIVCGDKKTGVTTMLMDEGIDTGDMLEVAELPITKEDTAETLHDRMALAGAKLLSSTIFGLVEGRIQPVKQPEEGVSYAPILTKEMGKLDFSKSAECLSCLIRGFYSWPLTYFVHGTRRFKVWQAEPVCGCAYQPGTYFEQDGEPMIACGEDSALRLVEICPDGSKKMDARAFVNGRFLEIGAILNA